ncbi:hypothetical protein BJ912DRAFT_929648 [Pholiota molesta]|nr:hypothetical protein BJ912DRAFT_929648 [Pholiota molesta]
MASNQASTSKSSPTSSKFKLAKYYTWFLESISGVGLGAMVTHSTLLSILTRQSMGMMRHWVILLLWCTLIKELSLSDDDQKSFISTEVYLMWERIAEVASSECLQTLENDFVELLRGGTLPLGLCLALCIPKEGMETLKEKMSMQSIERLKDHTSLIFWLDLPSLKSSAQNLAWSSLTAQCYPLRKILIVLEEWRQAGSR